NATSMSSRPLCRVNGNTSCGQLGITETFASTKSSLRFRTAMTDHLHLRFPFNASDRAVIGDSLENLTVTEVPLRPIPQPGEVPSESLLVSLLLPSPSASPIPQVRPIFSGQITFLLDPAQVALVPQPDAISFAPDGTLAPATFSVLPRVGMLLVE